MSSGKFLFGLIWHVACLEFVLSRYPSSPLVPYTEYIFVSQPGQRSVAVTEVNALTRKVVRDSRPLITKGLREPSGLAVDHSRQRLYVADPKSHKVFMYKLYFGDDGLSVHEDQQYVAARDVTPRWVALDEEGTLFCTDEGRSFIAEIDAKDLDQLGQQDVMNDDVRPQFHRLYAGEQTRQVDKPGGIDVRGNKLYWGNRARGRPYGSLLSAPEDPQAELARGVPEMIKALSNNVDKVYGVCASPSLVFYTGSARDVYGAKPGSYQARANTKVLLNNYASPRGCVWDGDGTVFLADKGGDAVWSFPSSMHNIGLFQATKLFSVEDPYGVAVFRPSLAFNAVGFLRGAGTQVGPGFAPVLLVTLAILRYIA